MNTTLKININKFVARMKILCTWKLFRMTRRIRIRSPFVRHTSLTYRTRKFPPPFHLSENAKHREYFPGCSPPSPVSPTTAFWAHLASRFVLSCTVMLMLALYLLFLPPLLSGRLRDRCCCCPVRLRSWRPLLLARATRQAPLITRYCLFFSILLALE